jgi:hypothetical protein
MSLKEFQYKRFRQTFVSRIAVVLTTFFVLYVTLHDCSQLNMHIGQYIVGILRATIFYISIYAHVNKKYKAA